MKRRGEREGSDSPVEHAEELHDPLFSSRSTDRRNLNRESMHAAVVSEDGEATEVDAVRPRHVKLVGKVTDANVVGIVVLVLYHLMSYITLENENGTTHLEVLTGNFDLVELLVLEFDEPVTD